MEEFLVEKVFNYLNTFELDLYPLYNEVDNKIYILNVYDYYDDIIKFCEDNELCLCEARKITRDCEEYFQTGNSKDVKWEYHSSLYWICEA